MKVIVLRKTENPQQLVWASAHQCVSPDSLEFTKMPDEAMAGEFVVKHLLAGNRGHYSPLEAPAISFNVVGFPHSTMQQFRTHRIGIHFSVQSFRYTGQQIIDVAEGKRSVEDVFYFRPLGHYTDRNGKRYEYTEVNLENDKEVCRNAAHYYAMRVNQGFSEEHARDLIPFNIRQHWAMSCNVRSLMHLLDLRAPANAQLECNVLCDQLMNHFTEWTPAIAQWYLDNRWRKARLSP